MERISPKFVKPLNIEKCESVHAEAIKLGVDCWHKLSHILPLVFHREKAISDDYRDNQK